MKLILLICVRVYFVPENIGHALPVRLDMLGDYEIFEVQLH